ncbi:hypothetical protein ABZP36_029115 [Zizania latifolia]
MFFTKDMESVNLDVNQFFKAMESVLGTKDAFFSTDESDYESDVVEKPGEKDMGNAFMESYSDALNKELSMTTIEKRFARAQRPDTNNKGPLDAADTDGEMTPVDVDLNLVESFLNSYSSQQGLSGPASNLLGLMGVKVPPDAKKS